MKCWGVTLVMECNPIRGGGGGNEKSLYTRETEISSGLVDHFSHVQTLPYLYITCDIVFFGCHFKVDSVLFHYKCFVGWIGCCECDW